MAMPTAYEFDVQDLVMSSAAHYLGRRTANVSDFCDRLCRSWVCLPPPVQAFIRRIVDEAFERERHARTTLPLGDQCDRESWDRVRSCWTSTSPAETAGQAQDDAV
jgi:hypothetical protein